MTLQHAIEAIDQGEIKEGLSILNRLRNTSDHDTLFQIAQLYQELGFIEEAIDVLDELIAFYPDVNDLKLFAAELNVEADREQEALDLLSGIRTEDDEYLQALLLSADLYERQGLDEVAEQKLLEAKRLAPNEPVISFGLGEFYLFHGNFQKGMLYYQELYEQGIKELNGVTISLRLAESSSGAGAFEEAVRFYEEGISDDSNPDVWFGYGLTASRIEDYQKAIRAFNHLKELDPQYTTLYPLLAKAFEQEGAYEEALQTYTEGIRLDEYNEDLYLQAGKLAIRLNDFSKGEELLKHVLSINPTNTEAALTIMKMYESEDQYEELIELGTEIERYGELEAVLLWKLAQAYRELEIDDDALKRYETAYNGLKDDVEFLEDYGSYMLEIGRRNEAIELYKRALSLDSDLIHLEEELFRLENQ